jgi:hypothetical protein
VIRETHEPREIFSLSSPNEERAGGEEQIISKSIPLTSILSPLSGARKKN